MFLQLLEKTTGIFVVVYDGQHALKFTLGKAGDVVGPGVHFKFPIVQTYKVEDTKHTTLDLEPQIIQLQDDLIYEVEAKVMYQIVDLRKAVIEIDDLITGMQNRVVMAVQRVIQRQDRHTIRDTDQITEDILSELSDMQIQWGVKILQFGFSNISPSPATLEITQLELLTRERLSLYQRLREAGMRADSSVALIAGAVVTTSPDEIPENLKELSVQEKDIAAAVHETIKSDEAKARGKKKRDMQ